MVKRKILIVEDDVVSSSLYMYYLAKSNVDLTITKFVTEAISLVLNNNFDLVICDVILNQSKNGLDIYNHLVNVGNKTPILFCTAYKNYLPDFIDPRYILPKPITREMLLSRINEIADYEDITND